MLNIADLDEPQTVTTGQSFSTSAGFPCLMLWQLPLTARGKWTLSNKLTALTHKQRHLTA